MADPSREGGLVQGDLFPGQKTSCNLLNPVLLGRLWTSTGKSLKQYCGGSTWVDNASGYIDVQPQLSFMVSDTLHVKLLFERMAQSCGVKMIDRHMNNGNFGAVGLWTKVQANGPGCSL